MVIMHELENDDDLISFQKIGKKNLEKNSFSLQPEDGSLVHSKSNQMSRYFFLAFSVITCDSYDVSAVRMQTKKKSCFCECIDFCVTSYKNR